MPNDEIIIIKPKRIVSPMSDWQTAERLRDVADAIDAGEIDVKDSDED